MNNEIVLISIPKNELLSLVSDCITSCLKHHKFDFPKEEKQEEYLTGKQVDALLKVSAPTRHKYVKDGLLKKHKIGGRVLYKKLEVNQALKSVEAKRG
jgi:predicted DNA-binding transcriptional regulator AlpA